MKKLLKKKVNVFGKEISVFAIVILGLALVSAALVPYLSGLVIGTVEVESPITLQISTESENGWGDSVALPSIHGSETVTFYIQEETHINDLVSNLLIRVEETEYGVDDCGEFTSVTFQQISPETGDVQDITGLCKVVDIEGINYLEFNVLSDMPTAGERVYEVKATFALNALGDYEATIQHVPTA